MDEETLGGEALSSFGRNNNAVSPAKAGVQSKSLHSAAWSRRKKVFRLDSGVRRNDMLWD
jgi:hypothetical protein